MPPAQSLPAATSPQNSRRKISRRTFHRAALQFAAGLACSRAWRNAPAQSRAAARPQVPFGVASGDVSDTAAVIWSRADRPARMQVELAATEQFRRARRVLGPEVLEHQDFTGKVFVRGLPAGETVYYRVRFESLEEPGTWSEPVVGRLKTAPTTASPIRFIWTGDTCGQGYGIDPARGGIVGFEAMRRMAPDFLINSGDTIYADNPFPESITLADGSQWRNLLTPETAKVAETLDEFRANYRYNLLDENVRRFNSEVPILAQWDDHETCNNWYPGEQLLADDRFSVKSASLLAARARRAFFDYMPLRESLATPGRIYRRIAYGPLLDVFFIDMRSYRDANSANNQLQLTADVGILGKPQLEWLKRSLAESKAVWKVIASDMPLGLIVADDRNQYEAVANGPGQPLGRELEIAHLVGELKRRAVRNVIWLTADVHYAASHYYDPSRAVFQDFDPFWEFVSGPIHAGTFGPGRLDDTFGPQLVFKAIPDGMKPNRPPSEGLQFFGLVEIDPGSRELTVSHYNTAGERLWSRSLSPEGV